MSRKDEIATASAKSQHLPPLVKQDSPPVELHWTLEIPIRPFTIDLDELWQRARPASVAGADALTLSPEDLLLHLCLHTSVHHLYSNGLRAFCDIREIVRHYQDELDWETMQARAHQWGSGNSVYLTLYFAKSLLNADVPDDFLNTLRPNSCTPKTVTEFNRMIFKQGHKSYSIVSLYRSMSVIEKTKFFLERILLSPEELGSKYLVPSNSPLICLYYFVRMRDVLVKYSRIVWQIWSKDKTTAQQLHLIDWLSR